MSLLLELCCLDYVGFGIVSFYVSCLAVSLVCVLEGCCRLLFVTGLIVVVCYSLEVV